tara:strand:+ start:379 stop:834 length:456 start_codon:yes stop_codon:yes gene_type:complete
MKIAIGGDHGGFDLKEKIKAILQSKKHEVIDLGAYDYVPTDDYPDFCFPVAKMVSNNEADRGIISCMSGIGAVITANKVKGVRAGLCHTEYLARQGVEHDDMNVLCIGSKIVDHKIVEDMIEEFLNAKFLSEEKYSRRLKKVIDIEKSEGN